MSVRVCHKSVFYRNGWTDRVSFWHVRFFRPILHCFKEIQVSTKITVFPSWTLSQTPDLEKILLGAYRSLKRVINFAWQWWTATTGPSSSDVRPSQVIIKLCVQHDTVARVSWRQLILVSKYCYLFSCLRGITLWSLPLLCLDFNLTVCRFANVYLQFCTPNATFQENYIFFILYIFYFFLAATIVRGHSFSSANRPSRKTIKPKY